MYDLIGHRKMKAYHSFNILTSAEMIIMHWLPQVGVGLVYVLYLLKD